MSELSLKDFENFFKYYAEEPQQRKGVSILYDQMRDVLKQEDHEWITAYRSKGEAVSSNENILNVKYQSQNDNVSGTGYRECFSSSCAMVAMYYGVIENDDAYNKIRQQYGDSTDATAQVRTLRSLGLEAHFKTDGTTEALARQIELGRPTPCGWLHKGPVNAPTGGGHYSVVIGMTNDAWIHNDPNGEAKLAGGGYEDNLNGSHLSYSKKNWEPRWLVEGEGSGWYMDISNPD